MRFHRESGRYASLSELVLHTGGLISPDLAYGNGIPYKVRLEVHVRGYALWLDANAPQLAKGPLYSICCCLGTAPVFSFYSDETGTIRMERSCRPASVRSHELGT